MVQRFLQHAVVKNALWLYVVQFASYLPPLITLPYLTRVLGPEKFGLIAFAQSFIWYFITLTEYGFNLTATRRIAVHRGDAAELSRTFSAVMIAKLLLTLLGLAMLLALVFTWPKLRPNWNLFLVAFLAVVGNLLFPLWLYQGLEKLQHVALRDLTAKLIALAALFVLVHRDSDYLIAAGLQSGGLVVAGFVGLVSAPFLARVRFRLPAWSAVREALRAGWPVFLSIAATTLHGATNIFILGLKDAGHEVAYYSGAQRMVSALGALVVPVVTAVYPHISHKAARSEEEAVRFVRRYALWLAAPFFLAGVGLFVTAPWVVRLVLGRQYGPAALVLRIMAFSPCVLSLSHSYSTCYMLACGYEKQWMRIILLSVAVNFLVLVPMLYLTRGSVALAVTGTVVELFAVSSYWRFYRRRAARLSTSPNSLS